MLLQLIKHELNWNVPRMKSRNTFHKTILWAIGIAAFTVALWSVTTLNVVFEPQNEWYFLIAFPFLVSFTTYGLVNVEWHNHTPEWWLCLPYSRSTLLSAKLWGGIMANVFLFAGIYVFFALFCFCSIPFVSGFGFQAFTASLSNHLESFILLIFTGPIMGSLGILAAIIGRSLSKTAIIVLSTLYGAGIGAFSAYAGDHHGLASELFSFSLLKMILIVASWILAYFMIRGSAHLLQRKIHL